MFNARFSTITSFLVFALIIGAAFAYRQWIFSEDIVQINGKAVQVIDGDSFKSRDEEFRIYGIDAPEYRQMCKDSKRLDWACGKVARSGLEKVLREADHRCTVRTRDQFGRLVVLCQNELGVDLSSRLVRAGLALSGQSFDEVIYAADERSARNAKRGIWQGDFMRPELWRAQNPRN